MGKQQQARDDWVVLGWCAVLCIVLWKGAEAQENASQPVWGIVGILPRFCKVGGDAGWNIPQGNSTSLQNWADRSNASQCGAFVFTSAPGAKHSVTVIATTTDDRNLTAASVCQDQSVKSASGRRNHFSTNGSLIILKSNLVYCFLSGVVGDCAAGLSFCVKGSAEPLGGTGSTSSIDQSRSARDVGVVYNIEPDPESPRGFGFGLYAPPQPVFLIGTAQRTTIFYGDAIAGSFTASETPVKQFANQGPISCHNHMEAFGYGSPVDILFYSWMDPAQQFDHSIVALGLDPNSTSLTESYCTAGVPVADVAVASTRKDDCSINPGPPYRCDAGLNIKVPGTILITILIVAMLILVH